MSSEKIVKSAESWVGKIYKEGQAAMCADFVSTVLQTAGYNYFTQWCPDMSDEEGKQPWGKRVSKFNELQAGDIILFDRTYLDETLTHVGIYIGNNCMIDRPTMSAPVRRQELTDYWTSRFNQGRRVWTENMNDKDFEVYQHGGKMKIKFLKNKNILKGDMYEFDMEVYQGNMRKI